MPDITPKFTPGQGFTVTASAAVTGGRLVVPTGGRRVAHGAAGALNVAGVALRDAAAEAELPIENQGVFALLAAVAVAAGDRVRCEAGGQIGPLGVNPNEQTVGIAWEAIAVGATGLVQLRGLS